MEKDWGVLKQNYGALEKDLGQPWGGLEEERLMQRVPPHPSVARRNRTGVLVGVPLRALSFLLLRLTISFCFCCLTLVIFRLTMLMSLTHSVDSKDYIQLDALQALNSTVETQLFNDSCPFDLLGLPDYVTAVCPDATEQSPCRTLTCRNLLTSNDSALHAYARQFTYLHRRPTLSDAHMVLLTANCAEFRARRGYERKLGLKEDLDFSLAFSLIVHRSAEQVERLIYALFRPQHQLCVHVDAKAPPLFKAAIVGVARCLAPQVFIASRLEQVIYGGFSRLQADLNCMRDHVTRGGPWRYLLNSAGEAFPLRSQREMIQILRLYNGTNDIEGMYGQSIAARRFLFEEIHEESIIFGQVESKGTRNSPPPFDLDIVKGSAYAAFSRDFVSYVLEDRYAAGLLQWSRRTYSPDEIFWATMNHRFINPHLRPPGGSRGYPSQALFTAVYANWGELPCHGQVVRYICVHGTGDLPSILERRELFVNKFYADHEPLALDCLRAWVEHKDRCPVTFNYEFYRQLAHRDDQLG